MSNHKCLYCGSWLASNRLYCDSCVDGDDDNFEIHSPSKGEPGYRAPLSAAGQEAVTALIEATPKLLLDREVKEVLSRLCDAYAACNGEDHPAYNAARKLLSRG